MWGENVGESVPLVRGLSNRGRSEIVRSVHVFGGGGERLAVTHSSRPGNAPKPPPPKLRAPEEPSGTPSAEQAFAIRDELEIGQLADQNAQARKTGMKLWRRKTTGALTASLGGLGGKQSLQSRGDGSPRRCLTNTRMRHDWCSPAVESKIRQGHLGQNQDGGK